MVVILALSLRGTLKRPAPSVGIGKASGSKTVVMTCPIQKADQIAAYPNGCVPSKSQGCSKPVLHSATR